MNALRAALPLMLLIALCGAASVGEVPIPPSPSLWVTDTAGFLQPQTVSTLDDRLVAYQNATGHQVLVYIAPTTGTTPTEDWTVHAFAKWKVGRKGMDDGLVLFVFPTDRTVRIEVGYGLEGTVPDAIAARIIRDTITPKLRAGDPDGAVTAGVNAILATIGGETTSAPAAAVPPAVPNTYDEDDGNNPTSVFIGIILGLVLIGLMLFAFRALGRAFPDRGPYISGGNSGFGLWGGLMLGGSILGGLGGGGFSGGGGMSGGGGATGRW
jgi:uncharacterized protein